MITQNICRGVDLHLVEVPQFKTNRLSISFYIPIKRETVTYAALLPSVMKRGSEKYPTLTLLAEYLENLYGAGCSTSVRFKGDGEVLTFSLSYIRDRFIGESLTATLLQFMKDWVFAPYLIDGAFSPDYVKGEKVNLKNTIEGIINDKKTYADSKCVEAMFGKVGYGMSYCGYVEDLSDITPNGLYDFYRDLIANAKIDIFADGSFEEDFPQMVKEVFKDVLLPRDAGYVETEVAVHTGDEIQRIEEKFDVVQSKLAIGLKCGVQPTSDEYYAILLANCIYGSSPFSKLFTNVREKLSLAYYAVSRMDRFKSSMIISSGLQPEKVEEAYDEILLQLENLKAGDFTEGDMEAAKKYLFTGLRAMKDSLRSMEDYYLSQCILGTNESIDELIEKISRVDKKAVVNVAQKMVLDTVYLVSGNKAEVQ